MKRLGLLFLLLATPSCDQLWGINNSPDLGSSGVDLAGTTSTTDLAQPVDSGMAYGPPDMVVPPTVSTEPIDPLIVGTKPNLNAVWGYPQIGTDPAFMVAVGTAGTILVRSQMGPVMWSKKQSNIGVQLNGVWGADADHIYVVGDGGTILVGSIASSAWTKMDTGGTARALYAVWGTDKSHVWAVGEAGSVLYFDGTSWSAKGALGTTLTAVWGADNNHVWVAGSNRTVAFYPGATAMPTWMTTTPSEVAKSISILATVPALGTNVVYSDRSVLSCDQGGCVPTRMGDSTKPALTGMAPADGGALFWVAQDGSYGSCDPMTNSFGNSSSPGIPLHGVWENSSFVWMVGDNGTILHRLRL